MSRVAALGPVQPFESAAPITALQREELITVVGRTASQRQKGRHPVQPIAATKNRDAWDSRQPGYSCSTSDDKRLNHRHGKIVSLDKEHGCLYPLKP